jgi:type I restriction enzyme, S subunit
MNKQTNIPTLRFPEFKGEWEKKKLGEVATFSKGKGISKADIEEDGKIECIRYGELYTLYGETINEVKSRTNIEAKNLVFSEANDVIIPASGETQIDIATASCVVRKGIALGGDLNIIKTKNNGVYLSYCLNSSKKQEIANLAQGISVVHLYSSQLSTLSISFPTLPEQTKIAEFFTAIDAKIQALKTKKEKLQQYKKGVMQQLFSSSELGLERLEDDRIEDDKIEDEEKENPTIIKSKKSKFRQENDKAFPKWEKKNGNEIFDTISNKNHNSDLPILAISQEFGAVPREMINYQISVTEKSVDSYKVVEVGDFIISLRSFQGGIEFSKYKGICSPAYIILRNSIPINSLFYKEYFKTDFYIQKLCEKLEGIRDGKMISYKYFSDIKLPYPSLPEQTKIANFLSSLDEKINHTESQIQQMQAWKKGLLQKMFV